MEHFVRIRDRILGADWSVIQPTKAFHSEITRAGSVLLGSGEQTRGRTAPSKTHCEKELSFRENVNSSAVGGRCGGAPVDPIAEAAPP